MAISLSPTNMLTFKDARTLLLESYLDGVIGDDEFILIYDETFSKSLEFPYEFLFIYLFFIFAIMTSKRENTQTTHKTPLVPLQCCSCWFQFHLLFFFFQFTSQFSREKVVAISMCPFVNFQINSFNSVHVFSDLFPFLCSCICALFCSSEGINNHDFRAQHFVVKTTPYHRLRKKIRFQFKQNLKLRMKSINNKTEWNSITLPQAAIVK